MSVLVIAEHDNSGLKPATLNCIAAAAQLGDVTLLVAGHNCQAAASSAAAAEKVTKVLVADDASLDHGLAEPLSQLVTGLAKDYEAVLAPATTFGKNLLPRVAALLDVAQISEITAVLGADRFVRPIFAGNALATVQSNDSIKIITVRGTAFDPVAATGGAAAIETVMVAPLAAATGARFVDQQLSKSERPELTAARIVVSGGRGMGSGENFKLIEAVADKLGAAVGASRAAVDSGYAPNDFQVGQTGKIVAPDLYVAVGISGAIQHLAGMKDSKVIVAINKDEEAPIFQVADYSLVADLFQALPELAKELSK